MASITLQGLPASPGIAVGRCWTVDRRKVRTPRRKVAAAEVEAELGRLEAAIELSVSQLDGVKAKMQAAEGAEHLAILEVHRAMLRDPSLVDEARRLVREEQVNVEWAVKRAIRKIKGAFDPDDEFFRERRSDVDYVGERIVKNLLGQGVDVVETPPPGSIVVARDLSPADTALLFHDRKVAGLVTDAGGITSHTAIVARALEIPAVVGAGRATAVAERGDWVVVDGGRGVVVVNPSAGERADYEAARIRQLEREAELARLKDLPAETVDGVRLRMLGNIEFGEEVPGLLSHGGEGVGLYRTEFLFMGRAELPTEEDHYRDYRAILEAMDGRPVTVRTFDLGGDKLPSGQKDHSENPALGLRAVRYCLRHPELFHAQLRAAVRAAAHGNLRLMFPMVSGVVEVRAAKWMLAEAYEEVLAQGLPGRMPPVGIMVELPSAVLVADRLAAGGRLPLHRHERPHPVHHRGGPPEQGRGLPLQAAAPGGPAHAALRRRRRPGRREAGVDVRRDGRRAALHAGAPRPGARRALHERAVHPAREAGDPQRLGARGARAARSDPRASTPPTTSSARSAPR